VTVLTAGDAERTVLLAAHSAICDGWSLDVLLEDLGRLYSSFAALGAPSRLPAHGIGDFAARRACAETADQAEQARAYWRRQLTPPPPPLALPYDRPRPPARSFTARASKHRVSAESMATAKAFARSQGVSFFSALFAGFVAQLQRRSGATDLCVGVSFAGHPAAGMEDAVGRLVSVVPVRLRLKGEEEFAELCRRCHAAILDASGSAAVGIEELAGELEHTGPSVSPAACKTRGAGAAPRRTPVFHAVTSRAVPE
jgi:hypothetical protein